MRPHLHEVLVKNGYIATRVPAALLFALPLWLGLSISRESIKSLIIYKMLWPMGLVPADHPPRYLEIKQAVLCMISILPMAIFCGLIFGYLFNKKTTAFALVPAAALIVSFMISLRSHWFYWTVYFEYGFFVLSFICFSMAGAKLSVKINQNAGLKKRLFAGTAAAIVAAAWLHFYYPLLGHRVSGEGFEGIVLSKLIVENLGIRPAQWWDINDNDIRRLEEDLRTYVETHGDTLGPLLKTGLASYRRWYDARMSKAGERQIHVFLMHESQVSRARWLHQLFGVAGGGAYYWNMIYNIKDGSFEDVQGNADA